MLFSAEYALWCAHLINKDRCDDADIREGNDVELSASNDGFPKKVIA